MNGARLGLVLVVLVVLAACESTEPDVELRPEATADGWAVLGRTCPADAPATTLSVAARDSVTFPKPYHDSRWAEIARGVPGGWGGSFYERGTPTMYLVDPSQKEAAASALIAEGMLAGTAVKKGRWDFNQMYEWYQYLRPRLYGYHQSDIDESDNRLWYAVIDEAARRRVELHLAFMDVPCFLVALGIRPYAVAL